MQSWKEFQGNYELDASCPDAYVGLDYWDVIGSFEGHGCNTGKTITIKGTPPGYKLQVGFGGNSHNCNFGISTWFDAEMDGHSVAADIYMNLDPACYNALRPFPNCENIVHNNEFDFDNDGWYLAVQLSLIHISEPTRPY